MTEPKEILPFISVVFVLVSASVGLFSVNVGAVVSTRIVATGNVEVLPVPALSTAVAVRV